MEICQPHSVYKRQNGKLADSDPGILCVFLVTPHYSRMPHHSRFMFRCECTLCLFRSTSYWHVSLPVFSKSLGGSFRVYKCESTIAGPTYENKLATLISLEWPLWVVVLPFSGFDRNSKPAPGQTKNFVCNNATKLFTTPEAWVVVSGEKPKWKTSKRLQVFREQMEIRTNGNLEPNSLT